MFTTPDHQLEVQEAFLGFPHATGVQGNVRVLLCPHAHPPLHSSDHLRNRKQRQHRPAKRQRETDGG